MVKRLEQFSVRKDLAIGIASDDDDRDYDLAVASI